MKISKKITKGIITDGELRRFGQKNENLHNTIVKDIMTKKPLSINKDVLAIECLNLMNKNRISECYPKKN